MFQKKGGYCYTFFLKTLERVNVFLRDEYARYYVISYFVCDYVYLHIFPVCVFKWIHYKC